MMLSKSILDAQLIQIQAIASLRGVSKVLRTMHGTRFEEFSPKFHRYYLHCHSRSPYMRERSQQNGQAVTASHATTVRKFSTTDRYYKGQKHKNRFAEEEEQRQDKSSGRKASSDAGSAPLTEAVGLVSLRETITQIHGKLKQNLALLKSGGQFSPSFIESIRVDMSKLMPSEPANPANSRNHTKETKVAWTKNDPETHEQPQESAKLSKKKTSVKNSRPPHAATVPLKEVAQVIPRGGKTAVIMLNEEDFLKPVTSALLNSPYSLNPQPSATNTLELIVPIPAPSAETRKMNASQADKYFERAETSLRDGRADMQKTLRTLNLDGSLGPDAFRKALKDMEKVVDDAKKEYVRMRDATKKALL